MTKENTKKMIYLLRKNREKTLQVLINYLKDTNVRIKIPNELLEELFIKKQEIEIDPKTKKTTYISKFILDSKTKKLYKHFNFSDFKYNNLFIDSNETLDIMRENQITLYTKDIFNKKLTHCEFKGIKIDGKFNGWIIEGSNFSECLGKPEINPKELADKSLHNVNLKDTHVVGNCNDIDVSGTSFKGADISEDFYLNPQKVKAKSLIGTKLSGVKIKGSFDGINILNTDFSDCITDLILDLDKLNLSVEYELKYNVFKGITLKGDLTKFKLYSNDFTGAKNASIDFATNSHIQTSSSSNIFTDVEFKNMHKASDYFLFENNNNFSKSYLIYDAYNCEKELKWYNKIMSNKDYKYYSMENIILVNEDKTLEQEIENIFSQEIKHQKEQKKLLKTLNKKI